MDFESIECRVDMTIRLSELPDRSLSPEQKGVADDDPHCPPE